MSKRYKITIEEQLVYEGTGSKYLRISKKTSNGNERSIFLDLQARSDLAKDIGLIIKEKQTKVIKPNYLVELHHRKVFNDQGERVPKGDPYILIQTPQNRSLTISDLHGFMNELLKL